MVEYKTDGEKLICKFQQRMDTDVCQDCEGELFKKIEKVKDVTFDLKDVDYISSLFLAMCLRASKVLSGGTFSIVNLHPNVKKVFKIAGIDTQLALE